MTKVSLSLRLGKYKSDRKSSLQAAVSPSSSAWHRESLKDRNEKGAMTFFNYQGAMNAYSDSCAARREAKLCGVRQIKQLCK